MGKKYLTVNNIHREFGLPIDRLRAWVKEGRCPGFRSGNRYYIDGPALLAKLEAGDFARKEGTKNDKV